MFGSGKAIGLITKGGAQQFAEEHLKARPWGNIIVGGIIIIGVQEERTALENESTGSRRI
jgi:hypothetical protein